MNQNEFGVIFFRFLTITGVHIASARSLLCWTQVELAKKANVAFGTIRRLEAAQRNAVVCQYATLKKVTDVLEHAGIEFLNDDVAPGVRLLKKR
jgi:predicted transcriptional regulator